jgi:uncharacterized surface protein with fasciclin (FAS1) repeats
MQIKKVLPLALATAVSAQQSMNITAAVTSSPDLSQLAGVLGQQPELMTALASASNITVLAPSNQAFDALMSSDMASALGDPAVVAALLQYHVLNGTYLAANFTETPAFIPTLLTDEMYANVTGGQVVEVIGMGGKVAIYSGSLAKSTVSEGVS